MSSDGSITRWITELRRGEDDAAARLWSTYFGRMVAVAGRKLNAAGRVSDDEDAALSAFKSFCMGARAGKFPQLTDRDNLWPLLIALTSHKCVDMIRRSARQKRGGGTMHTALELDVITSREPGPELLAEINDRLTMLLGQLDRTGDSELRPIALERLQGVPIEEIAELHDVSRRTIERKLRVIEQVWGHTSVDDQETES